MNTEILKTPLLQQAKIHRDNFEFAETLALLHQAQVSHPDNIAILYLLAGTYFESKNMSEALEYCDKALELDINCKEVLELKGIVLKKDEKYDDAEEYLLKVLELDPNMYETRKHLASFYYFCNTDYQKGNEHCEYILQYRDPDRDTMSRSKKKQVVKWLRDITWIVCLQTKVHH